ncbi:hypothetical protein [Adhaeretor mobilis]|uniref:Lipoprotein n=1 Tax=Adhaeretor mobilis TaxID=1930276 RepID=A0A517MZ14_9BACT|nr:hypothetical protein [Adhaeretor mobilis]QDT00131.1 hypothetical protein HG15A2_34660 [Adhaeretor mobilis]
MRTHNALTLVLMLSIAGCETPELPGTDVELTAGEQADIAEAAKVEEPEPLAVDEHGVNEGATTFNADSPEKGRKSKAAGSYLGSVAHAHFWAKHELIRIQLQNQMNVFNAINDRWPKDWEEYQKEIVKPLGIELPELPEGQEFVYDPEDHELKVQPIQ